MKIGLYNDSFPPMIDGVANTMLNYAKYITQNHGQAVVVTPRYPHVVDQYPFPVYRYSSLSTGGHIPYRVGNPFSPTTIKDLRSMDMDLLHVHSPFASSTLVQHQTALPRHRRPLVLTYHTKFDIDIDKYVKNKKFNKISKKYVMHNIRLADEVWCVTDGAGKWLQSTGYERDYVVMPNGTDFQKGRAPEEALQEIDRVWRLQPEEKVFLFCGRMMWYKNVKLIIDTLKELKAAGLKFRMLFVGDGRDRYAIQQYCTRQAMDDVCIFTGAIYERERVRAFFSRADLLLFPSTYDTAGLVVKEAAACGCPSLLVAGSCPAEGVVDGKNGVLAFEDPGNCAKKILQAVRTEGLLGQMGQAASETLYLSWEDAVARAWERYGVVYENYYRKNGKKR